VFANLVGTLNLNQLAKQKTPLVRPQILLITWCRGGAFKGYIIFGRLFGYSASNYKGVGDLSTEEGDKFSPYFGHGYYSFASTNSYLDPKKVDCGTRRLSVE